MQDDEKKNIKGVFITGTGTDVGKTFVSLAIMDLLQKRGLDPVFIKPIQTGTGYTNCDAKLINETIEINKKKQNQKSEQNTFEQEVVKGIRLINPCSPHLAAALESKYITQSDIHKLSEEIIAFLLKTQKFGVIEGAGGIYVPITTDKKYTIIDIIKLLQLPTIIVSSGSLGCINDTCSTIYTIQNTGIQIKGFIFNDIKGSLVERECKCGGKVKITHQNNEITINRNNKINKYCKNCLNKIIIADNAQTISEITKEKFLGIIPYVSSPNKLIKQSNIEHIDF